MEEIRLLDAQCGQGDTCLALVGRGYEIEDLRCEKERLRVSMGRAMEMCEKYHDVTGTSAFSDIAAYLRIMLEVGR